MNGVFGGDATETEKYITELTIDVFPDNLETRGVVFQSIVSITKAMQDNWDSPVIMEKPWPESEAGGLWSIWKLQLVLDGEETLRRYLVTKIFHRWRHMFSSAYRFLTGDQCTCAGSHELNFICVNIRSEKYFRAYALRTSIWNEICHVCSRGTEFD